MAKKKPKERKPFFVDPDFKRKVQEIQGKLLTNGERKSQPDITKLMIEVPSFAQVEKEVLSKLNISDPAIDFRLKLDAKKLLR